MDQPFLPYGRQNIDEDDIAAVVEVLRGDWMTTGPAVARFEAELADRLDVPQAVAVSNGTAALHAACAAIGLGPGDEVIVPAITFLATASCALLVGADPVFADVDPDTGLILPSEVERLMGPRTRAVLPVHMGGAVADLAAIRAITGPAVKIIEDAAHALGAVAPDGPVGSCRTADLATFSFHPVKHIAMGEGGAVTTRDPELAASLRRFRNHGMERDPERLEHPSPGPWWYEQQELGHNLRITDMQCALGSSQLRRLDGFLARRRSLASRYHALLAEVGGVEPVTPLLDLDSSAWHLFQVLLDVPGRGIDRAALVAALRERGIGTQVHYIPLPMQPLHRRRGADPADVPGAMAFYERTLTLPLFPGMQDTDVDRVVQALADALPGTTRSRR